jgi:hypothetical protein
MSCSSDPIPALATTTTAAAAADEPEACEGTDNEGNTHS